MTTKSFNCWKCRFFKNSSSVNNGGFCHRNAPHAQDDYGVLAASDSIKCEAGNIDADIVIGGACQLYRGGVDTGLPSVPPTGLYEDSNCFPFVTGQGEYPIKIIWNCSLMNVGTATVGGDVKLLFNIVRVGETTEIYKQIELPVNEALVGVAGATTKNWQSGTYNFNIFEQLPQGNFGIQLDLSETDNNRIAEILNPNFALYLNMFNDALDGNISGRHFAKIANGVDYWCGQFKLNNGVIPVPPISGD